MRCASPQSSSRHQSPMPAPGRQVLRAPGTHSRARLTLMGESRLPGLVLYSKHSNRRELACALGGRLPARGLARGTARSSPCAMRGNRLLGWAVGCAALLGATLANAEAP